MKIVIDEKIPYLRNALESMGHVVVAKAGNYIMNEDLKDADALFVRTRTLCNAALLDGSKVGFIGTATIGYDHIDAEYCHKHGIVWSNAPGCNAGGVLQYVQSSIYAWCRHCGIEPCDLTVGIVGVGAIGSRVASWASDLGIRVLLNDPPRAAVNPDGFVSLREIANESDIITFHPTLQFGGDYPSFHLADEHFFSMLKKTPFLINASRGPVVDNEALLNAYEKGEVCGMAIDVWENEPDISGKLLNAAFIATPHIAGYSAEGKLNATRIVLEKFALFAGFSGELPNVSLPVPDNCNVKAKNESEAFLEIYNPLTDTKELKSNPDLFEYMRNNYEFRRESGSYNISYI